MKNSRSATPLPSPAGATSNRELPRIPWSSRLLSLLGCLCVEHQGSLLGCMPGAPVLYSPA
ncbi:MAG: hypothetical protein ACN6QY_24835 [Pseudomonas sp.]|uniref:hypothetical protein n=1 Tax=unclassified Pseudomonas TaxID=196821 RepID=UPI001CFB44E9|nr:hypothetical protein [Pseudomonas sp. L5B5]UCZ85024.1 hypothetical protein LGQ10_01510 [Pseudomonas sp. L5B5]